MIELALVALLFAAYALVAVRLDRWSVSGPMALVATGALLGPAAVAILPTVTETDAVRLLAELTLAIILVTDASTISLREAEGIARLPARLLAVGLPLTIAAGAFVGYLLFPDLGIGFALLLGTIVAPTDAALALPFITDLRLPVRVRRTVNIESGLNDGIATPFVTLFLAVTAAEEGITSRDWLASAVAEMLIAVAVAAVVGGGGGWLLAAARRRRWTTATSEQLFVVAIAILAYCGASAVGGNGFVAAFVAGIAFRTAAGRVEPATEFAEVLGLAASYLVWLIFGISLVGPIVALGFDPVYLVYAVVSLTVVRMAPVAVALARSRLRPDTVAVIGWFGPRGLASIVFVLVAIETLGLDHPATDTLVRAATWTILLSVVAHGLSARPLAALYARRLATAPATAPELEAAEEPRVPGRHVLRRSAVRYGAGGTGIARPETGAADGT